MRVGAPGAGLVYGALRGLGVGVEGVFGGVDQFDRVLELWGGLERARRAAGWWVGGGKGEEMGDGKGEGRTPGLESGARHGCGGWESWWRGVECLWVRYRSAELYVGWRGASVASPGTSAGKSTTKSLNHEFDNLQVQPLYDI